MSIEAIAKLTLIVWIVFLIVIGGGVLAEVLEAFLARREQRAVERRIEDLRWR